MGFGHRYFLFEADCTMRRIPMRVMEGLTFGTMALPAYAGQTLRLASVILAIEDKKPLQILRLDCSYLEFDAAGQVREAMMRTAIEARETHDEAREEAAAAAWAGPGQVVSVAARIGRRRWEERSRWQVDQADLDRIIAAIWSGRAGRPVKSPRLIRASEVLEL